MCETFMKFTSMSFSEGFKGYFMCEQYALVSAKEPR